MGDSGSLVLGLALGVVSLFAIARSTLFISLLVPILAAEFPSRITAVAIIRRKRAHQRVDQPDTGTSIIVYYEQDSRKTQPLA